jgi:peptidoglycan hydrolase-like protein with peptidoglycan-binding domain
MNSGANGSRVGTIQKFLGVYFSDETVSIDNDFGPTTKGLVKDFQTAELNGGDGRVGPNTMRAMVEFLR